MPFPVHLTASLVIDIPWQGEPAELQFKPSGTSMSSHQQLTQDCCCPGIMAIHNMQESNCLSAIINICQRKIMFLLVFYKLQSIFLLFLSSTIHCNLVKLIGQTILFYKWRNWGSERWLGQWVYLQSQNNLLSSIALCSPQWELSKK